MVMDKKELYKRMDKLTSVLVRNLGDKCVTCGKRLPYNRRQAGHYIPRAVIATRWDLRNVNVQCAECNVALEGNIKKYSKYMAKHYGVNVKSMYDLVYEAYKNGKLKATPVDKVIDIYNDYLTAVRDIESDKGEKLIPEEWVIISGENL